MRKLILAVAVLLTAVLFIFQGFRQSYPIPEAVTGTEIFVSSGEDINDALDAIYFNISIMGVREATVDGIAEDFSVDPTLFAEVYGRYTDGRFGIADIIIVRPAAGEEAAARDALITIRTSRTSLFHNYDIYGASELASGGTIYSRGDYLILLMIENSDAIREQLDQSIPA